MAHVKRAITRRAITVSITFSQGESLTVRWTDSSVTVAAPPTPDERTIEEIRDAAHRLMDADLPLETTTTQFTAIAALATTPANLAARLRAAFPVRA